MKNDLTCGVVRDLLPSFVEGLTCGETNQAVEAHLASCPDCAARRDAMASPVEAAAEQAMEVDYLKGVKRRNRKRVALAVVCTVLILLAGLAARVFLIGAHVISDNVAVLSAETDGDNILHLSVTSVSSSTAFHRWSIQTENGQAIIDARQVVVSPLHPSGDAQLDIPLDGISSVFLCGRLIWQEGVYLQPSTLTLYETRTPYVGNAPALGEIAAALNIFSECGSFTYELQTAQEPYGWTLCFSSCTERQAARLNSKMASLAPQMLALVGNLGEVSWTYTDENGAPQSRTITLAEVNGLLTELTEAYNAAHSASWEVRASVKDYAGSPAGLQQLRELFGG